MRSFEQLESRDLPSTLTSAVFQPNSITLNGSHLSPGSRVHLHGPGVDATYKAAWIDTRHLRVNVSVTEGAWRAEVVRPGHSNPLNWTVKYEPQRVVGYILNSDPHRADIDYGMLTNVIYSSFGANSDGTLKIDGLTPVRLQYVVERAHAAGAKVSLSFGCINTSFHDIAVNSQALATFTGRLKELVALYNVDGIDLDWEGRPGPNATDYYTLIKALRTEMPDKLLSVAVNAKRHDLSPASVKYLDWVAMMGYDLAAGQHAGTAASEAYLSSWATVVPRSKLLLGVPFYGKDKNEVGCLYGKIVDDAHPPFTADQAYDAVLNKTWYYNGVETMRSKSTYVLKNGYGGIMIWELGEDHFENGAYDQWSLLPVIYRVLGRYRVE